MSTFSPLQREAFSRRQPEQIDFSRTPRYRLQPVAVDLTRFRAVEIEDGGEGVWNLSSL